MVGAGVLLGGAPPIAPSSLRLSLVWRCEVWGDATAV
jgi:hypothetical protein